MRFDKKLMLDETGLVLSAESVMIGTVGVLGAVVGLNMVTTSVDAELKEMAFAIRSLDQSYGYVGHQSCHAWSAGSYYRQPDVNKSLAELCAQGDADVNAIIKKVDAQRKATAVPATPAPIDPATAAPVEAPTPVIPNQISIPPRKSEPSPKSDQTP